MFLGYNTNGFAHHRLEDAIDILAGLGYQGVAVTIDYHALHCLEPTFARQRRAIKHKLQTHALGGVIETGARFLLDPYRKHQPTLISRVLTDRFQRLNALYLAIDLARQLRLPVVSFWSGTATDDAKPSTLFRRLVPLCRRLADHAGRHVRLAFEPEPGMFIDTMDKFAELYERVNHPAFGLTLDIGHLQCQGELPIGAHIRRWKHVLWNVHIEDMRRGLHDHLMFGEGEIDFADVFAALRAIDYQGGIFVELSRHSHDAVETARKSLAFLRRFTPGPGPN